MKVLYVVDPKGENPYAVDLANGVEKYAQVYLSVSAFYTNEHFDIIHFHWPESLSGWKNLTSDELEEIKNLILLKKKKGSKVIYTLHNKQPHQKAGRELKLLYTFLESNADGIIHLGKYSFEQFESNTVKQYIIPHQKYEYENIISKQQAREKLKLPQDKIVLLVFGKIRSLEEQTTILNFFKRFKNANKYLLVPRWYDASRPVLYRFIDLIKFYFINNVEVKQIKNCSIGKGSVPDSMIQYYFSAADVLFIPRKVGINSGLIPLSFSFGKAVIGLDTGNVGAILQATGNIVLKNTKDIKNYTYSTSEWLHRLKQMGRNNLDIAEKEWALDKVAAKTFTFYSEVLK